MGPSDNHDSSPSSPSTTNMTTKPSIVRRRDAVFDVLRAIEQQRYNVECPYTACQCRYRSDAHKLIWHYDPYAPQLEPCPLLAHIGALPELVNRILSHLDLGNLYNCVRVNKTWAKEAKRFIWHSADVKHLLSTSMLDQCVSDYAALVRHLNWQAFTNMPFEVDFWGYGPGFSTTRPIPTLPRITSLVCESSSLCNQTVERLSNIFVPTLTRLVVQDDAASRSHDGILLLSELWGVSWFDVMTQNCPVLTSITFDSGLWIDTVTFQRFVKNAKHLTSVSLGSDNEHLLVNALAPSLKSAKVTIDPDWEGYAIILRQLSKMQALQHLELTLRDVLLTGSTINKFKALTKLKSLKVYTKGSYALTGCSATAGQLAEMLEAMPLLNEFRMAVPCEFMDSQRELLGDCWEVGTYFEHRSCRQEYLNYLHELAGEDQANVIAVSDTT